MYFKFFLLSIMEKAYFVSLITISLFQLHQTLNPTAKLNQSKGVEHSVKIKPIVLQ